MSLLVFLMKGFACCGHRPLLAPFFRDALRSHAGSNCLWLIQQTGGVGSSENLGFYFGCCLTLTSWVRKKLWDQLSMSWMRTNSIVLASSGDEVDMDIHGWTFSQELTVRSDVPTMPGPPWKFTKVQSKNNTACVVMLVEPATHLKKLGFASTCPPFFGGSWAKLRKHIFMNRPKKKDQATYSKWLLARFIIYNPFLEDICLYT